MAKLNKSGIQDGQVIYASALSQSIDALTSPNSRSLELSISGSLLITGSITGSDGVVNPLTASYAITSSYALNAGSGADSDWYDSGTYLTSSKTVLITGSLNISASSDVTKGILVNKAIGIGDAFIDGTGGIPNANLHISSSGNDAILDIESSDQAAVLRLTGGTGAGATNAFIDFEEENGAQRWVAGLYGDGDQFIISTASLFSDIPAHTLEIDRTTLDVNIPYTASATWFSCSEAGNINPLTASYAITASHALNSGGGGGSSLWYDGTTYLTSSKAIVITGSLIISSSDESPYFDFQGDGTGLLRNGYFSHAGLASSATESNRWQPLGSFPYTGYTSKSGRFLVQLYGGSSGQARLAEIDWSYKNQSGSSQWFSAVINSYGKDAFPSSSLRVLNDGRASDHVTGSINFFMYVDETYTRPYITSLGNTDFQFSSSIFMNEASMSLQPNVGFSSGFGINEGITIDANNNGYVGIGKQNPSTDLDISGSVFITGSISGSDGVINWLTSSYAITASHALNSGGSTFPFVGDAVITGSLTISGSFHAFTLDSDNIVLGIGAGTSMLASANYNVVLGTNAGAALTSGDDNVIIGSGSAPALNTGNQNVIIGENAGKSIAAGTTNVMIGRDTDGGANFHGNVCVGDGAGHSGLQNYNVAIGQDAMGQAGTGNYNIALGNQSYHDGSGDHNIILGYHCGHALAAGDNNIFIGSGSIGASGLADQLRIGHGNTNGTHIISGSLVTGDIIFPSTASATYFVGDGSQLTNLPAASSVWYDGTTYISSSVAIIVSGSSQMTGSLVITGSFEATTKSFLIDHPTKEGYQLQYGSLEGPEHGVFIRGTLKDENIITLPDHWKGLVHDDSITVQLTAIGKPCVHYVDEIKDYEVYVGCEDNLPHCYYFIQGERKDVGKLKTEI